MKKEWFQKTFLGPNTTFRNGNRTWLYLGYVALFVGIIGWLTYRAS
jgi:hypothetical protein